MRDNRVTAAGIIDRSVGVDSRTDVRVGAGGGKFGGGGEVVWFGGEWRFWWYMYGCFLYMKINASVKSTKVLSDLIIDSPKG